jgi:hypothetical protein
MNNTEVFNHLVREYPSFGTANIWSLVDFIDELVKREAEKGIKEKIAEEVAKANLQHDEELEEHIIEIDRLESKVADKDKEIAQLKAHIRMCDDEMRDFLRCVGKQEDRF